MKDVSRHIGATARIVRHIERDGRPAHAVVASRTYDTDIADLWNALTEAERIPRWFLPISGDLRLGGRFQLTGNAGGEITACIPPSHFSLTWEAGGEVTWVNVTLSAASANTTHLELEHIAHVDDSKWKEFGPGAVGVGWDGALMGLGEHLTGKPAVVPAEAMQWIASAEGKDFMRRSSDAWRDAAIASGTSEQAATEAARRTTAAYTGEA